MKEITVKIEGTTPLLCNRFGEDAQASATNGTRPALSGSRGTPHEQAERKLYIGTAGKPVVPGINLFRAIIDGGIFFKAGKSKVTTAKTSLIPACVSISEMELRIESKDGWIPDSRPVRIPSTGARIICHRPCFNDWSLAFTLSYDEAMIDARLLRQIVDAAGTRIGLGDFRPGCKGMFGKFVVNKWQEK